VGREGGNGEGVESGGYGRRMRGVRKSEIAKQSGRSGTRGGTEREWKRESNVIKRSRCLAKKGRSEEERERREKGEEKGDRKRERRNVKQRKDAREGAGEETKGNETGRRERERERKRVHKRGLKGGNDKTVENARLERSRWERLSYYPEGHLINMAIFLLAFGEASERCSSERTSEREKNVEHHEECINASQRRAEAPTRGQGGGRELVSARSE